MPAETPGLDGGARMPKAARDAAAWAAKRRAALVEAERKRNERRQREANPNTHAGSCHPEAPLAPPAALDEGSYHMQAWWERDASNERRRRVVNAAKALRGDPRLDAVRGRWGDPAEPDAPRPGAKADDERPAWDAEFAKESPFKDGFGWNRRAANQAPGNKPRPAPGAPPPGRLMPWEEEAEATENGHVSAHADDYDAANYRSPRPAAQQPARGGALVGANNAPASPMREAMPESLVGRLEQRRRQRAAELEARRAAAEADAETGNQGPVDVLESPTGLSPNQNRRRRRMWDMPPDANPAAATAAAAAAAAAARANSITPSADRQPSNNTFTRRVAAMANVMDRGQPSGAPPQKPSPADRRMPAQARQPSAQAKTPRNAVPATPPRPKTGGERAAAAKPKGGPDPNVPYGIPPRSSPGCHGSDYVPPEPRRQSVATNVARPLMRAAPDVPQQRGALVEAAGGGGAGQRGVHRVEKGDRGNYPVAYIASDKRGAVPGAAEGAIPIKKPSKAPTNPALANGAPAGPPPGRAAPRKASAAPRRGVRQNGPKPPPPDDPDTRQMFDKRRMRVEHRHAFSACVFAWRSMRAAVAAFGAAAADAEARRSKGHIKSFVRKRPLFEHEQRKGEFDVVTVPKDAGNVVVVHNCLTYPDLKRLYAKHVLHRDGIAQCFDDAVKDTTVYSTAAAPLVRHALGGGIAALFMYGQTGSGKTFTMSGIERRAMTELFDASVRAEVAGQAPGNGSAPLAYATVRFFEIAGKRAIDLLHPSTPEFPVKEEVPSASNGYVGGADVSRSSVRRVSSAQDLLALIEEGKGRRATSPTLVNASSSRSHAVLSITLPMAPAAGGDPAPDGGVPPGRLVLVDCAGSERKEDSMYHDANQRKEGAEINASLWALKECARALNLVKRGGRQHVHVPYRSSTLTKVLQEAFARHDAMLHVIGTVSPSASDTEHSLETLKFVTMLGGKTGAREDGSGDVGGAGEEREDVPRDLRWDPDAGAAMRHIAKRVVPPHLWDHDELVQWVRGQRGAASQCRIPPNLTGRELVRMNRAALEALCGGDGAAGAALHDLLRAEIQRCSDLKSKGAL